MKIKEKEDLNGVLNKRVLGAKSEYEKLLTQIEVQKQEWQKEKDDLVFRINSLKDENEKIANKNRQYENDI